MLEISFTGSFGNTTMIHVIIPFIALVGCAFLSWKISQCGKLKYIWFSAFLTGSCFSNFVTNLFLYIVQKISEG